PLTERLAPPHPHPGWGVVVHPPPEIDRTARAAPRPLPIRGESGTLFPQASRSGERAGRGQALLEYLALLAVRDDLSLHALQRVVDGLRVAAQVRGHLLVGRALEVQAKRVRLELREPGAEAEHEALQLLGRDDADRRVVDARARQGVAERAVALRVL